MSNKISKKLTMAERFVLLKSLPQQGDFVTFKILRKLRETLSPSEAEIKEYAFQNQYRCPHLEYDEKGKSFQCEVELDGESPIQCPIHSKTMVPVGRVSWNPDKWYEEKEIWFGAKANSIIVGALKKISDEDKQINDDIIAGLYEKFLGIDEGEE